MAVEWLRKEPSSPSSSPGDLLGDFFSVRGYSSSDEIQNFLNFSLKDLKDPSLLKDMDKAVERLVLAQKQKETVCVYADFDMDGTPGLALMVRGLKGLGFTQVIPVQPHRHNDGYGFHAHLVEKLINEQKISLFVTIDVGITDHAAVQKAKDLGVDVIITDHHQVKEQAPDALAVVNPNQPNCKADMGYLCGTGVGFYLIMALRRELRKQNLLAQDFDIKTLLDCFAIGTVADMVPLIKENRVLVKHGLKVLEKTSMIGLRQLLIALKLSEKRLSAQDVGMRFVPKLNSLSRLETPLKAIDLFLVEDIIEAQKMVSDVLKNNERRVLMLDEAESLLQKMVDQEIHEDRQSFFYWSPDFHRGLVGLLATHLVQTYQKPAFVGSLTEDGSIVGSARAPEGTGLSVFAALKESESHLEKFGGHPAAAGFEVHPDKAELLKEALENYFEKQEGGWDSQVQFYDKEVQFSQIQKFMDRWDELEPFGMNFEPPIFRLDQLRLTAQKELKGGHLKLTFQEASGRSFEALWFFPSQPEILQNAQSSLFSMLCEPQWNEFMGSRRVQLLLKDIKSF